MSQPRPSSSSFLKALKLFWQLQKFWVRHVNNACFLVTFFGLSAAVSIFLTGSILRTAPREFASVVCSSVKYNNNNNNSHWDQRPLFLQWQPLRYGLWCAIEKAIVIPEAWPRDLQILTWRPITEDSSTSHIPILLYLMDLARIRQNIKRNIQRVAQNMIVSQGT